MKTKRFFVFGLPAVLLALGLVLVGCPTDGDDGGGNDTTPPALTSAVVENSAPNRLILTFNEAVTADSAAGWSLTGAAISGNPSGIGTATWTVSLAANITSGSALTISYNSSTGNTRDTAGNPLGNIASFAVTNNVGGGVNDTTPPVLIHAVVENSAPNRLALTFSEAVTADSVAGWSLTGATISGDPSGFGTAVWTVPLTANVSSASALTISYNSSTGNTRDSAGNALGNIASFAVTNNVSGGSGDTTVSLDDGTAGDNKVILALSTGNWKSAYMSFMTGANSVASFGFSGGAAGITASWVVKSNNARQVEVTFSGIDYSGTVSIHTGALSSFQSVLTENITGNLTISGSNSVNIVVTTGSNSFVPVEDIIELPAIAIVNTQMPLSGTVVPPSATNKTIVWDGEGVGNGVFNPTSNKTYTVTATIQNGTSASTPFTKTFEITAYIGNLHDYDGTWTQGSRTCVIDGNNWEFTDPSYGIGFRGIIVKPVGVNGCEVQTTSVYNNLQWVPHYFYYSGASYMVTGDTLTISTNGFDLVDGTYVKQ
jgi:endo-1,4-beta-xylanase